jgi:hypothetical protein
MPLSDAHLALASGWLRSRVPRFACPACGGPKQPGDALVMMNAVEPDGSISLGDGPLYVPVVCESCGHVDLFDARRMGISLEEEAEEPPGSDSGIDRLFT